MTYTLYKTTIKHAHVFLLFYGFKLLWPSCAIWCHKRLSPLPEPTLTYCQLDHYENNLTKFIQNSVFFEENALEFVVCKTSVCSVSWNQVLVCMTNLSISIRFRRCAPTIAPVPVRWNPIIWIKSIRIKPWQSTTKRKLRVILGVYCIQYTISATFTYLFMILSTCYSLDTVMVAKLCMSYAL